MKRLLSVLLIAVLAMSGCSSNTTTQPEATAAAEETSERQTLRVGMECNYAPFNWTTLEQGETGQPISDVDYCDGYDVMIATRLAEGMDMDVQIVKTDWDGLIPALNAGDIDAIVAGMTDTPERRESVNFTTPYYESDMVVVVNADSPLANITDIQEMSGYKVLGQQSTLYDDVIDQIEGVVHMTPQESYPRMVLSLQSGEADAITAELPVAQGVVSANEGLVIVRFEAGHGFEADTSVSVAVAKENTELLNSIQAVLDTIDEQTRQDLMLDANNRQPAQE